MGKAKREGNTVYDMWDKNTKVFFSATVVTHWWDGTLMNDLKRDNAIYFKLPDYLGGGYAMRNFEGNIQVPWYGALGSLAVDDSDAIFNAVNMANNLGVGLDLVANGKHKVTKDLKFNTFNKGNFELNLNKSTIYLYNAHINFHVNDNVPYLKTSITKQVYKGETFIQVASIAGVEPGDLVGLVSPALVAGSINLEQYYVISYIEIVGSIYKLYVENLIVSDVTDQQIIDSGKTGPIVVNLYKLSKNLTIRNGVIQSDKAHEFCMSVMNQNNFRTEDLIIYDAKRFGLYTQYSGNTYHRNCQSYRHGYTQRDQGYFNDPNAPGGLSFGYGFIHARNAYSELTNCRGGNGWHTYDAARGQTIIVYNNCSSTKDAFGFSTHEGAWDVIYNNPQSFGGAGITTRSVMLRVNGGYIKPSGTASHGITAGGKWNIQAIIKGTTIDMSGTTNSQFLFGEGAFIPEAGCMSIGSGTKLVFDENLVIPGKAPARMTLGSLDFVSFGNNKILGPVEISFAGKDILIGQNWIFGTISQWPFSVQRTAESKSLKVVGNRIMGNIGLLSNSCLVNISGAHSETGNIEISNNDCGGMYLVVRFGTDGIKANTMKDNYNFERLALGAAGNAIIYAERNKSFNGQDNVVAGTVPPPLNYYPSSGTTAARPANPPNGFEYFDNTLVRPVYFYGGTWRNALPDASVGTKGIVNRAVNVSEVAVSNATDLATVLALSNKNKEVINSFLAAVKAANIM